MHGMDFPLGRLYLSGGRDVNKGAIPQARSGLRRGARATPQSACGSQLPPSHRPSSLSCAGVAHGLFYDSAPTHLRCAGVPLGLFGKPKRSSFSRFAASIKPYHALFSKTHMLQVRCAHPTGTGESKGNPSGAAVPAPPFAPKRPFGTFRCCAWLFFRKEHTMLFSPKRTCFRFAARTLRVQGSQGNPSVRCGGQLPPSHRPSSLSCAGVAHGFFSEKSILCSFLQNAHASGSLRSPCGYRGARATPQALRRTAPPFAPTQLFELRQCCAWLIKIREHTVLSYLKRTCFRFAVRTLRVQGSQGNPSGVAVLTEKRPRRRLLRGRWKRGIGIFTASGGCRPVRCGRR